MTKGKRIDGWHRLWLLISAIYLLVVTAASAFLYPQPQSQDTFSQGERFDSSIALVKEYLKTNPDFVLQPPRLASEWGGIPQNQEGVEFEIAQLHAKYAGRVDFSAIETRFAHDLTGKRLRFVGIAFLLWFVPFALIYLLGHRGVVGNY